MAAPKITELHGPLPAGQHELRITLEPEPDHDWTEPVVEASVWVDDGTLSIPQVWAPRNDATIKLYVDALYGGEYLRLEGTGDAVKFRAVQGFQDVTVSARDEETAAHKEQWTARVPRDNLRITQLV
jgi:hypothetical protein